MKVKCNICGKELEEEEAVNCMFPGESQEYLCKECHVKKLREHLALSRKKKIEDIEQAIEKLEIICQNSDSEGEMEFYGDLVDWMKEYSGYVDREGKTPWHYFSKKSYAKPRFDAMLLIFDTTRNRLWIDEYDYDENKLASGKDFTDKMLWMMIPPLPVKVVPLNTPDYGISGENDK